MFSALDTGASIEIAAHHADSGLISVKVSLEKNVEAWHAEDAPSDDLLTMQYYRNNERIADNIYHVDDVGVKFKTRSRSDATIPFIGSDSTFVSGYLR